MIGFATSPRLVEHVTGPRHPERPDRMRAIARAVRLAGLIESPDPFPEFEIDLPLARAAGAQAMLELAPEPADPALATLVHTPAMIERSRRVCSLGGGVLDGQGDTPVGPTSFDMALLSLGCAIAAADAVGSGKVRRAFSAARPPGHHAEPDRAMGFCLFCNIAIAARRLQKSHGVGKVAIVDFDVHHGNGTQAAFESDDGVLFISLHQDPRTCYPGSGHAWETGEGRGCGFTLNVPLMPGSDDAAYLAAMEQHVLPKLDGFRPEILLISAGFDAHREDPLANMNVSDEGFELMTRLLSDAANAHSGGRIVSVLEGGYNLKSLGRSVVRHLIGLSD